MHCAIKLSLRSSKGFFGSGLAELLYLVEESHSLNVAAHSMGMAYSKAWRIIRIAEAELGYPLLERKIGGVDGGGSEVTARAHDLIRRFRLMEQALRKQADILFQQYFGDINSAEEGKNGDEREPAATTPVAAPRG